MSAPAPLVPTSAEPTQAIRPAADGARHDEALFWRELDGREPSAAQLARRRETRHGRPEEIRQAIRGLLRDYTRAVRRPADIRQVELVRSTYDAEELIAAVEVLLDDRMTMGPRVAEFEARWSRDLPAAFSIMVNSGSSANLLALAALAFPGNGAPLRPGDEVIVPAVCWSTSLFPIAQMGGVPVLVDVDPETLNIDPGCVEAAVTPRTRGIMAIHLLGNPCDMPCLRDIAARHGLWLVEDCCEAHGARIDGQQVGTFGDLASFSFFFSHHMTTIEGGLVCGADRARWHDLLVSMRAHGWIRGRSDHDEWVRRYPDIDPRWLFVTPGYNLRTTDINAAFGLVQLAKMPGFVQQRVATRLRVMDGLARFSEHFGFQHALDGHTHSAFGFALLVRPEAPFSRAEFQAYLEARGIQTRPIVGGNFARQPAMAHVPHRIAGRLPHADAVHDRGLMVANHHNLTVSQQDYLLQCVAAFVQQRTGGA